METQQEMAQNFVMEEPEIQTEKQIVPSERVNEKEQEQGQKETVEERVEESNFILPKISTQGIINSELKQLIVNENLDHLNAETLKQSLAAKFSDCSSLKRKLEQAQGVNKKLNEDVQIASEQTKQNEKRLKKQNYILKFLQKEVSHNENVIKHIRDKNIHGKINEQFKKITDLRTEFADKLKTLQSEEACLENAIKDNATIALEIENKTKHLQSMQKKYEELKKLRAASQVQFQKRLIERDALRNKLESMRNDKKTNKTEANDQELEYLLSVKDNSLKRLMLLRNQRAQLEEESKKYDAEIQLIKRKKDENESLCSVKKVEVEKLEKVLEETRVNCKNGIDLMEQKLSTVTGEVAELTKALENGTDFVEKLNTDLDDLKRQYDLKTKNKELLMTRFMNLKARNEELQLNYEKRESDIASSRDLLENLKNEESNKSIELTNTKEKFEGEKLRIHEILKNKDSTFETVKATHEKRILELNQQKEYAIASFAYLTEKEQNLTTKHKQVKEEHDRIEVENNLYKDIITQNNNELNELRQKLNIATSDVQKKVQFNDVVSFKTISTSDTSSSQNDSNVIEAEEPSMSFKDLFKSLQKN